MNQRGLAESTQWAVLAPSLLFLVLGLVQLGVWLHARTVVASAAAAVADVRALGTGQDASARAAGRRIAAEGGLSAINVDISAHAGVVVVTVSGRAPIFFDFGQGQVSGSAVLPHEVVTK